MKKMGLINEVIDPAPEFGTPDSTGFVVIECKALYDPPHKGNILDVFEFMVGALADALRGLDEIYDVHGANIVEDDGNRVFGGSYGVDWSETEELLIFGKVEPGNYRLSQIMVTYRDEDEERKFDHEKGEWVDETVVSYNSSTIDIPPNILDELSFEVKPGEPLYIGLLIVVDERGAREKNQYHIEKIPEYEMKAYRRIIKKYKESPWVGQWQERLAELEALNPVKKSD